MVVTSLPRTSFILTWQDLTGSWSTRTVQAPQIPSPQPYLTPVSPRSVRSTHKSLRLPSTANCTGLPFSLNSIFSIIAKSPVASIARVAADYVKKPECLALPSALSRAGFFTDTLCILTGSSAASKSGEQACEQASSARALDDFRASRYKASCHWHP